MSLLGLLRPADTVGWESLDADGQVALLRLARARNDADTVRMLAALRSLQGEARAELLAERDPSVRRRVLTRSDLSPGELASLLDGERRMNVLGALAGSADPKITARLVDVALDSRGVALAETLLAKAQLDAEQRGKLVGQLIGAGRRFAQLPTQARAQVVAGTDSPEALVWVVGDMTAWQVRWEVQAAIRHAADSCATADRALEFADALAGCGAWDGLEAFFSQLSGESAGDVRQAAGRRGLTGEDLGRVAAELPGRLAVWSPPQSTAEELAARLRSLTPVLPLLDGSDGSVTPLSELSEELLTATLVGGLGLLSAAQLAELACNPNHTEESAFRLAGELTRRSAVGVELFDRFDRLSPRVWDALDARREGEWSSVRVVLARLGRDRLVDALRSERFRAAESRWFWRRDRALLGFPSTLGWVLAGGIDPELDDIALDLPMSAVAGAEAATFQLLARHLDDPKVWEAVEGLAGGWQGTLRELIETARSVV